MLSIRLLKSLVVLIVIAVFLAFSASASLVSDVVIPSVGSIASSYTYTAKSGSAADVQAAINWVNANGTNHEGTVIIPAGNWTWSDQTVYDAAGININGTGLAGNNGHPNFTNYTASTILFQSESGSWSGSNYNCMIFVYGVSNSHITVHNKYAPTRISGIEFEVTPPSTGAQEGNIAMNGWPAIEIYESYNWRVDHCTFVNFCTTTIALSPYTEGNSSATMYGCIDHCTFTDFYKLTNPYGGGTTTAWSWGWCCYTWGAFDPNGALEKWSQPNAAVFYGYYGPMAGYSITYFEDCHSTYVSESVDSWSGGFTCCRFDLFSDASCGWGAQTTEDHGPIQGESSAGRGLEVYNCTYANWLASQCSNGVVTAYPWISPSDKGLMLRGGSALWHNNTYYGNGIGSNEIAVYLSEVTDDPSGDFLSYGQDCNQTYIWSNTYQGGGYTQFAADSVFTQNVNYFFSSPNNASLGAYHFKYTPHSYPIFPGSSGTTNGPTTLSQATYQLWAPLIERLRRPQLSVS